MTRREGSYSRVLRITVRLRVLNGLCSPLKRSSGERLYRIYLYVMYIYALLVVSEGHEKERKAEGDIIFH